MRESALLTVCAWCRRVRGHMGEWCDHDFPEASGRVATHGICPDCLETATAQASMMTASQ